jgi:uncharacterized OB-fold protein
MGKQIPMVDYLVLDAGDPHLEGNACTACGAVYLDRRNGCARCGGETFERKRLPADGILKAFTIVHRAAPGVPTPFVSALVDLGEGALVKGNLLEVEPRPEAVKLNMPVRLSTFVAGTDDDGTEAVAFGFAPA